MHAWLQPMGGLLTLKQEDSQEFLKRGKQAWQYATCNLLFHYHGRPQISSGGNFSNPSAILVAGATGLVLILWPAVTN
jgi:hypothetical protein